MRSLSVVEVGPEAAADVLAVVRRGFGARPALDPPSTALGETEGSVAAALDEGGGVLARRDGTPVGALLLDTSRPGLLGLRRVSVDPAHQGHGVASAMVGLAEDVAEVRDLDGTWCGAREELPETVVFWLRRGYAVTGRRGRLLQLAKALWVAVPVPTADATRAVGERLARLVRAGDLLVLSGDLGSGKTTLTQGIGAGLGVRGAVTSPTFVIARVHPSTVGGPDLVHVDAYRLGGFPELDDLDLDASVGESVTVVEWGGGLAELLADAWLDVRLDRLDNGGAVALTAAGPHAGAGSATARGGVAGADVPDGDDEARVVSVRPHGARWMSAPLRSTLLGAPLE